MKVRIKNFNVNWLNIKNSCRTTVNMEESIKEPTDEWKKKLLICRHSPIRKGTVDWEWEKIPYCTSVHFCRHHIGCEKWVSTSREDRTGVKREDRKQTDFVRMEMEANIETLMNISERRLCTCADATTRKYWQAVLEAIKEYDENIYWACVPQCVRHGACIEMFSDFNFYETLMKDATMEEQTDIIKRYDKYNEFRNKQKKG